jgi:hypothetical protein
VKEHEKKSKRVCKHLLAEGINTEKKAETVIGVVSVVFHIFTHLYTEPIWLRIPAGFMPLRSAFVRVTPPACMAKPRGHK